MKFAVVIKLQLHDQILTICLSMMTIYEGHVQKYQTVASQIVNILP